MKCPNCSLDLVMADRSGIEIDYCSSCRGIWLDRGELDKIIERSRRPDYEEHRPQPQQYYEKPYKRRKSFLEELFD